MENYIGIMAFVISLIFVLFAFFNLNKKYKQSIKEFNDLKNQNESLNQELISVKNQNLELNKKYVELQMVANHIIKENTFLNSILSNDKIMSLRKITKEMLN